MFTVAINTKNFFYEQGLLALLNVVFKEEGGGNLPAVSFCEHRSGGKENILFKDSMAIVNIYMESSESINDPSGSNNPMLTINIPFNSSRLDIYDVMSKIKKVLTISRLSCKSAFNKELFRRLRLSDYIQLSSIESEIVSLTGKGHDIGHISKVLGRSEKTILTHRRNAIRKLGVLNRLEFYNYASDMQNNNSSKEAIFICV